MILKNATRIISYLLIVFMLTSLFACKKSGNTDTLVSASENLSVKEFGETEEITDDIEKTILNNKGNVVFSAPQSDTFTVNENNLNFNGICNKNYTLTIGDNQIETSNEGYFSANYKLSLGKNEILVKNGDYEKVFNITYTMPLIKSYTPCDESLELDGGTKLSVTVTAKIGAQVKVNYNGKTTTLTPDNGGEQYTTYRGIITTAKSGNATIKFTATKDGNSESITASKIIIGGSGSYINTEPVVSMQNKGYINVGTEYVAEVIATTAECFLGGTVDDCSRPTVNYLPRGTMDYCSKSKIYDSESGKKYYILRNNTRIYSNSSNVKLYKKTLPETNKISFASSGVNGNHYFLNFKVDWRAPFRFNLGKQGYKSEKNQDYSISSADFTYVDITFCYAEELSGFNLSSNPIFKSYKVIKNEKDYTLRLYLKTKGVFYGWKASYTSNGELQFSFLNPAKIQKANNQYGYSLKGIKIVIDPGHGGTDGGTYTASGSKYVEKHYTLLYSKELANRLLKLGATVYMTRTEDKTMSLYERYNYITATGADLSISVHFNGSENGDSSGYFTGYFNPYTYAAAKNISSSIAATGQMARLNGGTDWHYFNLSRVSCCPSVLTENGYLTGINDYKKIKDPNFRKAYVDGIVDGIIKYFVAVSENAPTSGSYTTPSRIESSGNSSITLSTASKHTPSRITVDPNRIVSSQNSSKVQGSTKPQSSEKNNNSSKVSSLSPPSSSESTAPPNSESTTSDTSAEPTDTQK